MINISIGSLKARATLGVEDFMHTNTKLGNYTGQDTQEMSLVDPMPFCGRV